MTKFNQTTKRVDRVKNHEGGEAYTLPTKLELYSAVVTTLIAPKFYESETDVLKRIKDLVAKVAKTDPEFVAKLAVYARESMYLRTVPVVLAVELAKAHSGTPLVSKTLERVVRRPDEITETLAYYTTTNGRKGDKKLGKLSNQIRKGLGVSFNKFDEYQFAKYNRSAAISLKDALFLTHPVAKDAKQQAVFDKIVSGTLETPKTWETELSAAGKSDDKESSKKEAWEDMIMSQKMGYMATLRNLRNILQADVSEEAITKVADYLGNEKAVLSSKQFPFRFYSAARELQSVASPYTGRILAALEDAMRISASNIAGFDRNDTVAIATDVSGSMSSQLSEKSKMRLVDVGLVLSSMLTNATNKTYNMLFGSTLGYGNVTKGSVLTGVDQLERAARGLGHSTNGYLVAQELLTKKMNVDKLVIFTDMQLYENSGYGYWGSPRAASIRELWGKYKKEVNPNAELFIFDLAGYGTTPVSVKDGSTYLISGWSDRVFDILEATKYGSTAVKEIEQIKL